MDAIAAVVIGGYTAWRAIAGTILGTVLAPWPLVSLIIWWTAGVPSFLVGAIKGIIIIGALLIQRSVSKEEIGGGHDEIRLIKCDFGRYVI